jgi:hypothetical protein
MGNRWPNSGRSCRTSVRIDHLDTRNPADFDGLEELVRVIGV